MVLNDNERTALNKKIDKPNLLVKCPRCGSNIEYQQLSTAIVVKCTTEGCIKKTLRGI